MSKSIEAKTIHPQRLLISEQQVSDFLQATNPCYANLPAAMRDGVRDRLQRQADIGEISEQHLTEFSRGARLMRTLED